MNSPYCSVRFPRYLLPGFIVMTGLSLALVQLSQYSYLLFHSLAELFSILVAIIIFVVSWYTYAFSRNHFLMYLGCGYLWIGLLDLLHTLLYKGMTVFPLSVSANPATQFWLAGRFFEALVLLTAPFFLTHSLNRWYAMSVFGALACLLTVAIFLGIAPVAYQDGIGLTGFKVYSEYLIISMMACAALLLYRRRVQVSPRIYFIFLAGIALTISADWTFTFYVGVYDFSNLLGHILKLFSFWLIYEAIIHTTLHEPFTVMARNANTYNAIPQATVLLDQEGRLRQVNKSACLETGMQERELVGEDCHSIFHPAWLTREDCPICQALQEGRELPPTDLELDSQRGWRKFTLSRIDTEGRDREMVQVSTNINRRKKAEAELEATLHNLDITVSQRTYDLHAKVVELEQARDHLIASEKMASLGRLVAGFAHEINTPIGIAVGASSQLQYAAIEVNKMLSQDEIDEEELEEVVETINEGTELTLTNLRRAAELIQRFKRSSIDRTSEGMRSFRVKGVLEDVLVSLHNTLKKTKVNISIDCPDELRIISVPGLLEQVLVNLIQNSLTHGFEQGSKEGNISISCDARDNFRMVYRDDGKGMSADTLDHLFEPFYTTTRGSGSGLGMYISYNLVHRQHGTLYCESEPGLGVWFALDLPVGTMADLEQAAMKN